MEEKKEDQTPQNDLEKEELKKMIPLDKATAYISWIKEKLELDYIAESVKTCRYSEDKFIGVNLEWVLATKYKSVVRLSLSNVI